MSIRKRQWTATDGTIKTAWQVDFKATDGSRKARQFATKAAATAFSVTALAAVQRRDFIDERSNPTVEEAATGWLAHLQARVDAGDLERSSMAAPASLMKSHILNEGYGLPFEKIGFLTIGRIEKFRLNMLSSKAPTRNQRNTETNVTKTLKVLRQLLNWAVDNGYAAHNPMLGRRITKARRGVENERASKAPDAVGLAKILTAARERDAQARAIKAKGGTRGRKADDRFDAAELLIGFAASTALRWSELAGLDWRAVDLQKGEIQVRQRLDRFGQLGPPKTKAGNRVVPMSPRLQAAMKEYHFSKGRPAAGPVFCSAEGGPLSYNNFQRRTWRPILKAAGVSGLGIHGLRHFAISGWIMQGASLKLVQSRAGHGDLGVTLRTYSHLLGKDAGDAISATDSLLFSEK